jgi:phage terminase large subunit GpA-like protein
MLEHGQWIKHKPKAKMAGFHLSALYSPLGWFSWVDAVRSHLAAIGDPLLRKVWVNTVLGEVFSEITPTIDSHWLAKRVEKYDAIVPEGVLCLTAGADTHDDRVEISVYGWGEKGECWLIDHCIFLGNTKQSDVWELVDQHLLMQWEHRSGAMMNIATTCIDSQGHATDEVYGFVLPRQWRRVWAIKGMAGAGRGIVSRASKQKNGVYLILVGADQGKDYLYANLKNIVKPGPGYIHFPDTVDEKFFDQLTAERKLIRHSAGLPKSQWDLPAGKRNEALDCFVYAYAALKVLNPNLELLAQEKRVYQSDFTRPVAKKARRVISRGAQI